MTAEEGDAMSDGAQDNAKPRGRGEQTAAGRRRSRLNSRRHGLYAVVSSVPPVRGCPLRETPQCRCQVQDGWDPCPRFEALQRALAARFLRVPHLRDRPECWHLVGLLVENLVKLAEVDAWTWRAGWVRLTGGALDVQPIERARGTRAAETRRLSESLGLSPAAMSGLGLGGPEPLDLARAIAAAQEDPPHGDGR